VKRSASRAPKSTLLTCATQGVSPVEPSARRPRVPPPPRPHPSSTATPRAPAAESLSRDKAATSLLACWLPCAISHNLNRFLELGATVSASLGGSRGQPAGPFHARWAPLERRPVFQASPPSAANSATLIAGRSAKGPELPGESTPVEGAQEEAVAPAARRKRRHVAGWTPGVRHLGRPATPRGTLYRVRLPARA